MGTSVGGQGTARSREEDEMTLRFGTSGVRGLVSEMSDLECARYTLAFLRYMRESAPVSEVAVSGDLRSSTPRILGAVAFALQRENVTVLNCGFVPSPALLHFGIARKIPSIMVTGSHIPDDRNGIKFNRPDGEILKSDEERITRIYTELKESPAEMGKEFSSEGCLSADASRFLPSPVPDAARQYIERYGGFFPENCLDGLRIGVFQHSTVGRDIFVEILDRLGAAPVPLGRSDHFVAVDTEAVSGREQLAEWVQSNRLHALVSADGDADRPLVVAETGEIVRGDVLGILVADYLQARGVVVPVSCNTAVDLWQRFERVHRTRIGSPWVIEGMHQLIEQGLAPVVGYEANGGFLTGTEIAGRTGNTLTHLPTRDAVLPILSLLHASVVEHRPVSRLQQKLPPRFTESGLLRKFPSDLGNTTIDQFRSHGLSLARRFFAGSFGPPIALDLTDGARITFQSGEIIHLRPSGNAPEFRCYTEADTVDRTREMNVLATSMIADIIKPWVSARSGGECC